MAEVNRPLLNYFRLTFRTNTKLVNQIKSNRAYIAHFLQLNATQLPLHLITETDPAITSVLHVF